MTESCQTLVMKSTLASRNAANAAEKSRDARFESANERTRSSAGSMTGERCVRQRAQNAARPTAAAASEPIVRGVVPAPLGRLHEAEREHARSRRRSGPSRARSGRSCFSSRLSCSRRHAVDDRGEADREVDEEHEAPADLDEQAADAAVRRRRRGRRWPPRCRSRAERSLASNSGRSSASEVGSMQCGARGLNHAGTDRASRPMARRRRGPSPARRSPMPHRNARRRPCRSARRPAETISAASTIA